MQSKAKRRFRPRLLLLTAVLAGVAVFVGACLFGGRADPADRAYALARSEWELITPAAEWPDGYSFSSVNFRDELWVLGHAAGNFRSADGRTWTSAPSDVDFSHGYTVFVALEDAVYAIGGVEDRARMERKSVWRSKDGGHWTLLTDAPGWSARVWQACVAFDGRLWLLGGNDGSDRNDVWSSRDGAAWTQETAAAPWEGRCMHSAVAHDGQLWVLGGRREMDDWIETDFDDVWCSSDGRQWTRVTDSADWSPRFAAGSASWDGRLWMLGGSRFSQNNEVWSSLDGATWVEHEPAGWSPRFALAGTVFRNRLWVMGGKEGAGRFMNDVWALPARR